MGRTRLGTVLIAGGAGALLAAAAPSVLGQAQAGLWEISGSPGTKAPLRQCVSNVATLAEFEHRGSACSPKVISQSGSTTVIAYTCGGAGFGRSEVELITPRSLRIDTQGISHQLPFQYVLQARRVGDCPSRMDASRH